MYLLLSYSIAVSMIRLPNLLSFGMMLHLFIDELHSRLNCAADCVESKEEYTIMKKLLPKLTRMLLLIAMISMLTGIASASKWENKGDFKIFDHGNPKEVLYTGYYNGSMGLSTTSASVSLEVTDLIGLLPYGIGTNVFGYATQNNGDMVSLICAGYDHPSTKKSVIPYEGYYFTKIDDCEFRYCSNVITTQSLTA